MPADHQKIEVRPRNWLTPVALVILRYESSPGYELMERLEEFGFEQIDAEALYRTLRQMENEGLCESEWEAPEDGPARRTYAVTEAGEAYLAAWADACKKYPQLMDEFARVYRRRPSRSSE